MIALATSGPGHLPRTGLSICIPVYNEHDAIAETLKRCLALKADLKRVGVDELEVIAVDDGSKDGSAEVIAEFPQVRLIRHQVNRGYGAALKTGFAAGRELTVHARTEGGTRITFKANVRIDTPQELLYYQHGGILQFVLRQLLGGRQKPRALGGELPEPPAKPTNSGKVDQGSRESFPASDPPAY